MEILKPSSKELVSWNNLVSTIFHFEDFAIYHGSGSIR
jgi:hypothetical protein